MASARPILDQINIVSGKMSSTIAFYRLLGLDIPDAPGGKSGEPFHVSSASGEGAQLDLDSAAFAQVWNQGWRRREDLGGRVVVGFAVDSREEVDRIYARLTEAGHKGLQPPWDAFWGSRYAIVEDPNGIAVGLMSPQDAAKRYWPPEGWSD